MFVPFTLFIVSGLGIAISLFFKGRGIAGRETFLSKLSRRADPAVEVFYKKIEIKVKGFNLRQILIKLSILIVHVIRDFLDLLKTWIEMLQSRFDKIIAMIKGRGSVKRSMASSVYLKNIKAYKDEMNANKEAGKDLPL